MLLKPIARGLKTLESTQVTCSDVFTIWIGIAIGFQQVFFDPSQCLLWYSIENADRSTANSINKYYQETVSCYNRRFAIFMNDCTPGMFVLAYLLDPSTSFWYIGTLILKLRQFIIVMARWGSHFRPVSTLARIRHPPLSRSWSLMLGWCSKMNKNAHTRGMLPKGISWSNSWYVRASSLPCFHENWPHIKLTCIGRHPLTYHALICHYDSLGGSPYPKIAMTTFWR